MGDKQVKAVFFSGMSHGVKVAAPETLVKLRDRAFYLKGIPYKPNDPIERIVPFGGERNAHNAQTEASGIQDDDVGGYGVCPSCGKKAKYVLFTDGDFERRGQFCVHDPRKMRR